MKTRTKKQRFFGVWSSEMSPENVSEEKKNDTINLKGDILKYKWEVSLLIFVTGKKLDWQSYLNIYW